MPVVITLVLALHSRAAGAEELLVKGMGRTVGWVVATDTGEIRFRDCQGRLATVQDGRIESTTQHCDGAPAGVDVAGTVRTLDLRRQVMLVEDEAGRPHGFYVEEGRRDPPALAEVVVGQRVRVTGPVVGRATQIVRP